MKLELNEEASVASCVITAILALACISMFGCHQCENTTQEAIRAGLQQHQAQGSLSTFWAK
jgi:hypothetical protein